METIESICYIILVIIWLISSFKAWKYINKWETLIAIYYSIRAVWLLIIINLH